MIILRYKSFSALKDEVYEEKMKNKKKLAARRALALGALGAVAGGIAGHDYSWGNPGFTGMTALAGAGAAGLGGALHMSNTNRRVRKKLQRYKAADEKDKAFLRQLENLPQ